MNGLLFFIFHECCTCISNYSGYIKKTKYTFLPSYGFENNGKSHFQFESQNFSGITIFFLPQSKSQQIVSNNWGLKGFCEGKSYGQFQNVTLSSLKTHNSRINLSETHKKSIIKPLIANCNYSTIFIRGLYSNPNSYLDTREYINLWGNLLLSFSWISIGLFFFFNSLLNPHFFILLQSIIISAIILKGISFLFLCSIWSCLSSKGTYSYISSFFYSLFSIAGNSLFSYVILSASNGYGSYRDILFHSEKIHYFWISFSISISLHLLLKSNGIISQISFLVFLFQFIQFAKKILQAARRGERFLASSTGPAAPQQISQQYLIAIKFSWSILSWMTISSFLHPFFSIAQLNNSLKYFLIEFFFFIPALILVNFFTIQKKHYPKLENEEEEDEQKESIFKVAFSEEPLSTDFVFIDNHNFV